MTKRTKAPTWQPEIDQEYEQQVTALDTIEGHVSDYAGQYAIEPVRSAPPATWTPAQAPGERQQTERQQVVGHLRQMIDEQGREPGRTDTGNRFVITEDTSAKDRAAAGLVYFIMIAIGAPFLALGGGLWLFWGWGFFAFFFTFIGAGLLAAVLWLNWQAQRNSPIAIEKKQRGYDHEYRMYKEENAQRTRELVISGFIGNARQDVERQAPTVDGQLLLVDSQNEVKR